MEQPPRPVNPNRARDHLANERTYLAWMRTGIGMMGLGVVIVRLRFLLPSELSGTTHGWHLGLLFGLVGLLVVPCSTVHYFAVKNGIESDRYEPATLWVILFSAAVSLIGAATLYILLTAPAVVPGAPAVPQF
ncbi:MAG: YidH family protein [Armatimonadota bacterium]